MVTIASTARSASPTRLLLAALPLGGAVGGVFSNRSCNAWRRWSSSSYSIMPRDSMDSMKEKYEAFVREMGRLVLSWNSAEQHLVSLIRRIVVDTRAIDILTAHMTAEAKTQAIRVCASEMPDGDIKDSLLHACKYADILRDWRNHYVHNTGQTFLGGEELLGRTRQIKARHKLIVRHETVTTKDLERVQQSCEVFTDFAWRLDVWIEWQGKDFSNVYLHGEPLSLPDMPPLPLSLEEHRKSQQQPKPPPQSSQA